MPAPSEPRPRHLASFHLEAIRLGAASADERAWAEAHQRACERCASLAASLDGARAEFAADVLPKTRAALRARAPRAPVSRRRWWWAGAFLAPAAIAAVALLVPRKPVTVDDQGTIAEKGGPSLGIVARRGSRVFPVSSGEQMHPGDQIRFVLKGVTYPFGLIASVDGAGEPNIYVPYGGAASVSVAPGDRIELEGSIVLDGRLGPERVFALFSRRPLSAAAVREALAALGSLGGDAVRKASDLAVGADAQSSVLLEKVAE
jgi:hypothetical protein